MIPGPKVGLIIGKGGETIKQLQVRFVFSSGFWNGRRWVPFPLILERVCDPTGDGRLDS